MQLLASCDLTFDSRYATVDQVNADRAIEKGWIPYVMPPSATHIHEWHDLDANVGYGSFVFDTDDYEDFRRQMNQIRPHTKVIRPRIDNRPEWLYQLGSEPDRAALESAGFILFQHEHFYLAVNSEEGHAFFWNNYR